jgi:predicted ribosomally synthesized peptide with nif11-like leader
MSKEAVEQMMKSAGDDLVLQQQLETANGFAEVVQIGAEKGYQFTEADAQALLRERGIPTGDSADGELSEEALETVAGGFIYDGWRRRGW